LSEKERRSSERIKKTLHAQCHAYNTTESWSSIILQDMSEVGLSFLAREEIPIDRMLEIRISTFLRSKPISIIGKVVGCERRPVGRDWVIRLSIAQTNEEDRVIFKEVITAFLK
jgi:hypothetical protein